MSSDFDKPSFGNFIVGIVALAFAVGITLTMINNTFSITVLSALFRILVIVLVLIPCYAAGGYFIYQYLFSKFKRK